MEDRALNGWMPAIIQSSFEYLYYIFIKYKYSKLLRNIISA